MKLQIKQKYSERVPIYVVEFIAMHTDLSKIKIKDSIGNGGLWLKKNGQKSKMRIKKIKTLLQENDAIEFYYDSNLDFSKEAFAKEVYKGKEFSVWYKPAGLLSDGSPYAERGSISYLIKQSNRKCFLIQRLDREVSGLMLVAYSKKMAAFFSNELKEGKIQKFYQAQVIGHTEDKGMINTPLDGKEALTMYSLSHTDGGTSFLNIEITTGRYHQIRRHLDSIFHPIVGDPKYGEGNKNSDGLKLVAIVCEFFDPQKRIRQSVKLDMDLCLFE